MKSEKSSCAEFPIDTNPASLFVLSMTAEPIAPDCEMNAMPFCFGVGEKYVEFSFCDESMMP